MSAVVCRVFAVLLMSVVGTASAALLRTQKSAEPVEALTREDMMLSTPPQPAPSGVGPLTAPWGPGTILDKAESFTHQSLESQAAQMKIMKQKLKTQQDQIQRLRAKHLAHAPLLAKAPVTQGTKADGPLYLDQQGTKVTLGTKVVATSQAAAGAGAGAPTPKGWDQCLKYARWVKRQQISGVEFTRLWKTTCEPAVRSGKATPRYALMCNSLTGVVKPFSNQIDYDVESLCSQVLTVFADVTGVRR